ncbi:hypothetical protein PENDEC_c002G04612 [Penicillium decumbens]|uniref:Uncharacterized protein n=1 Tax=Penicillium decumbens TaxID=69771 RepID=A0A1V6PKS5_PENDC|nr:hypothetical protein PENDEC_c002G04612 [Penicillium decumbens]
MGTTRLHARRQGIMDSDLSQQPKSIIELHHPPPPDTNDPQHLPPLQMLKVKDTRAEQTLSTENTETRDTAIPIKSQNETNEVEHRFWNETTSQDTDSPASLNNTTTIAKAKTTLKISHASIAAATIIGIIIFGAISFLLFWYIRRERRARLRRIQSSDQDLFNPSSLTLAPETSKTLDDFLMKDIPPERASLMFSRTRSPSVTYVVDEINHSNRNSFDGPSVLTKLDTTIFIAELAQHLPTRITVGTNSPILSTVLSALDHHNGNNNYNCYDREKLPFTPRNHQLAKLYLARPAQSR